MDNITTMLSLLPLLLFMLFIGSIAGVLAGLLGIGGGLILVPAFYYVFTSLGYGGQGLIHICLATSLATIMITTTRSVLLHNKKGSVAWDILKIWGPQISCGAILGMLTVRYLNSIPLMMIFAFLCICAGIHMFMDTPKGIFHTALPTGIKRVVLSFIAGFLPVLMGIGGATFGVPLLTLYNVPVHRAIATAAGFGPFIAVPAVIGFLFLPRNTVAVLPPGTIGYVNVIGFVTVIIMTLFTVPLGVYLAHKTNAKKLRYIFAVFIIFVGLNMIKNALFI